MCVKLNLCITCKDVFLLFAGAILSILGTIRLIRHYKPKIRIEIPQINSGIIKIEVTNLSKCFMATNLRIEAAAVNGNFTYHLDFDRIDFLMLAKNKTYLNCETPYSRTYHAHDVNEYTKAIAPNCSNISDFIKLLEKQDYNLRIRVHAFHEFAGFGKAFESKFKLENKNFIQIT
jgi:hypothetical protein